MPTKRRKVQARQTGISDRAREAWRIGDWHALNRELGVKPWQTSPFDATRAEPPEWMAEDPDHPVLMGRAAWRRAWELRQRLLELGGPPGRVGRHGDPLGPAKVRRHADQAP